MTQPDLVLAWTVYLFDGDLDIQHLQIRYRRFLTCKVRCPTSDWCRSQCSDKSWNSRWSLFVRSYSLLIFCELGRVDKTYTIMNCVMRIKWFTSPLFYIEHYIHAPAQRNASHLKWNCFLELLIQILRCLFGWHTSVVLIKEYNHNLWLYYCPIIT